MSQSSSSKSSTSQSRSLQQIIQPNIQKLEMNKVRQIIQSQIQNLEINEENKKIKEKNQRMKEENQRMKKENKRMKEENQRMKEEIEAMEQPKLNVFENYIQKRRRLEQEMNEKTKRALQKIVQIQSRVFGLSPQEGLSEQQLNKLKRDIERTKNQIISNMPQNIVSDPNSLEQQQKKKKTTQQRKKITQN